MDRRCSFPSNDLSPNKIPVIRGHSSLSKTLIELESWGLHKVNHSRSRSYDVKLLSPEPWPIERRASDERVIMLEFHHEVFDSVKSGDLQKLKKILERDPNEAKCVNSEGFSLADIAILLNQTKIYTVLLEHGAQPKLLGNYRTYNRIPAVLEKLLAETEHHLAILSGSVNLKNKQDMGMRLDNWTSKRRLYKRMKTNHSLAGSPPSPSDVRIEVASRTSLRVSFSQPQTLTSSKKPESEAVIIGYRVQWCKSSSFRATEIQERFVTTLGARNDSRIGADIEGLQPLTRHHVRVISFNMKGSDDDSSMSSLVSETPSCWRDSELTTSPPRTFSPDRLDEIYELLETDRATDTEISNSPTSGSPPTSEKKSRWGIRRVFNENKSPRFHRYPKRGVYLACFMFNEEKVMITEEDKCLPMVECTEQFNPALFHTDFSWLSKVSENWDLLKQLKQDLERLTSVSSMHLRTKLLTAAHNLQNMIGQADLGQLHYRPIREGESIVLVTVRRVTDIKQLSIQPAVKWGSIMKTYKYIQPYDCLLPKIDEFKLIEEKSRAPLAPGLYLGYLQVKVKPDSIQIMVCKIRSNSLPCVKIRDSSHVSKSEWESLAGLNHLVELEDSGELIEFKKDIVRAAQRLTDDLDIAPDLVSEHRLHTSEVIEFSPRVSMLIIYPPRGGRPISSLLPRSEQPECSDHLFMHLKSLEMSHMHTYEPAFAQAYSRTALRLSAELTLAQQAVREAFSSDELAPAKMRLLECEGYQEEVSQAWRAARWPTDILANCRKRQCTDLPLKSLYRSVLLQTSQLQDRTPPLPSSLINPTGNVKSPEVNRRAGSRQVSSMYWDYRNRDSGYIDV